MINNEIKKEPNREEEYDKRNKKINLMEKNIEGLGSRGTN